MKVCVVGGGTAGEHAAYEAFNRGCDVTVVEGLEPSQPPWSAWPDLLPGGGPSSGRPEAAPRPASPFARRVRADATFVAPRVVSTSSGLHVTFDAAVVATGCDFEPTTVAGVRRDRVYVLNGPSEYIKLAGAIPRPARAVVQGEGARALEVASRLAAGGATVSVSVGCWQPFGPSPTTWSVIEEAAADRGVALLRCPATKALGSGPLEAVLSGGQVLPCDALVLVPRRVPRVVPGTPAVGSRGGLLVDRTLMTSSPGIYAAGGSAELWPDGATLADEPAASGRVAGANASGSSLCIGQAKFSRTCFLGLRWSRFDLRAPPSASSRSTARTVSRDAPSSACTIRYDALNGRVISVETIEPEESARLGAVPALQPSATLRTLAFGEPDGSSDISLVSDTARAGLEQWSES